MSIVSLRVRSLCLALGLSALPLLQVGRAHAADKALAESLFDAGRQQMQAGNYAEACPKFAESQRQDPSPGTLINLAKCYEALGRTASAWAEYKEAATLARTMGRDNQATFADEGAKRLEGSISKLRIDAPKGAISGLSVVRDGVEIGVGSLGVPLAVDPGEHVIEARAPGYKAFSAKVSVKANGDQQAVQLPELERDAAAAAPSVAPATAAVTTTEAAVVPSAPPPAPPAKSSDKTLAYVFGGVGAAGIIVGSVFAISAKSQANAASKDPDLCPQKVCTKAGRSEIDSAERKAMVANIGFGLGIVGLGVGAYFLFSGGKEAPPAAARLSPWVGRDGSGLSYSGAF